MRLINRMVPDSRGTGLIPLLTGVTAIVLHANPAENLSPEQVEFFESRIRPILAQDCYECHRSAGPKKGGLSLDHRAAWQAGGNSGPVILPGKPDESLLIQAIRHSLDDLKMPKSGAQLDQAIVHDFVQWVQMGAPDPREQPPTQAEVDRDQNWDAVLARRKNWWSFQPLTNPKPPPSSWSPHPVDQFVEATRAEAGLDANGPAPAPILVRRLYFALIGLPPTPHQIDDFVASYQRHPETAISEQVDELLASPHFGERWARHWMDWIRYAESHGSEGDPRIVNAHFYRDYLIRALNQDIPFDQLVREHVAGDQLESPRLNRELGINESLIGTAHWRMVFHGFAPTDALDEKVRFTDDQINVFSKAFLGLTVSCARCHNHKFDAISQKDYYAFFGIMGSTRPGRKAIDLPEIQDRNRSSIETLKPSIRDAIATDWLAALPTVKDRLKAFITEEDKDPKGELLRPLRETALKKSFSAAWEAVKSDWEQRDLAWKAHRKRGYPQRWDLSTSADHQKWYREGIGLKTGPVPAGAFSLSANGETAVSGIHPGGTYTHLVSTKHGGLLTSPDIDLDDAYEIWLRLKGAERSMSRYVVFNYPRNGTVYPVRDMRDDQDRWHWQRYDVDYWSGDEIHLEVATSDDAPLLVRDKPRSWFGVREIVMVKKGEPTPPKTPRRYLAPIFSITQENSVEQIDDLIGAYSTAIKLALQAWQAGTLSDDQAELLDECLRLALLPNKIDQLPSAAALIQEYRRLERAIPIPRRIPTVAEWKAQDQALFDRGNHTKPLAKVPRRFLEAIDPSPYRTQLSGRRQLAEDLLRDDNPLTRRVFVNRVWHHLFGRGIVSTPDNLGRLGARPSHPALLDHLGSYLTTRANWSIKQLIRYLVTSRTWRLASEPSPEARDLDPANDLLTHFNVQRLEAEAIRDALLQVSHRLDLRAFGNPVPGHEPRRSVYVNVVRNRLDPFLHTFDAPVPFSSQGRRNATTVPSQSLTMMNSDFVVETARHWGRQLGLEAARTPHKELVSRIWMRSFGRRPSPQERQQAVNFIERQGREYEVMAEAFKSKTEELANINRQRIDLEAKARARIRPDQETKGTNPAFLNPTAQWLFDEDGKDNVGNLDAELKGGAIIQDGALVVDGGDAYAQSARIRKDLTEKTFEAWVQLDDLDQQGGAAISLQTPDGEIFDAMVFGERESRRWMAGSEGFSRTEDFKAPQEDRADREPVHIAIVYRRDGTILGYRNGEPYGSKYKSSGPRTFENGEAEIVFGLRHATPSKDKMLRGRIFEARLYDRPLTVKEVKAASRKQGDFISQADLLAALSESERSTWKRLTQTHDVLSRTLGRLKEATPLAGRDEVWTDLALAVFNMKEFIYVR